MSLRACALRVLMHLDGQAGTDNDRLSKAAPGPPAQSIGWRKELQRVRARCREQTRSSCACLPQQQRSGHHYFNCILAVCACSSSPCVIPALPLQRGSQYFNYELEVHEVQHT